MLLSSAVCILCLSILKMSVDKTTTVKTAVPDRAPLDFGELNFMSFGKQFAFQYKQPFG